MAGPRTPILTDRERRIDAMAQRGFSAKRIAEVIGCSPDRVRATLDVIRPDIENDVEREDAIRKGSIELLAALRHKQMAADRSESDPPPSQRRARVPGAAELATPLEIFADAAFAFGCEPRSAWACGHAHGDVLMAYAAAAYILRHRRAVPATLTGIGNALRRDHNSIMNLLQHAKNFLKSDPQFAAIVDDLMTRAKPPAASTKLERKAA